MKHMALVVFSTFLALQFPARSAQEKTDVSSEDPLLGTWHLNVSKSTYAPGPPPTGQTRIYEKHPLGIKATVRTVYANGRLTVVQSVYNYDKQQYPVTGSEEIDVIVVTRISRYVDEATLSHAGRAIGTFQRVISRDGKQMTVTLRRTAPQTNNVEVYEKEQ